MKGNKQMKNKLDTFVFIIGALVGAFLSCLGWWAAWKLLTSFIGVTATITTIAVAVIGAAIGGACVSWKTPTNGDPAMQFKFNGPIARFVRRCIFWWLDCVFNLVSLVRIADKKQVDTPAEPVQGEIVN